MKKMAIDPVCKMDVDPKTAKWTSEHGGERYYFCAPGCKSAIDADPGKYLGGGGGHEGGHGQDHGHDMGHGGDHGGHGGEAHAHQEGKGRKWPWSKKR